MARTKAPRSSLALFPTPTRERAYELAARFPLGSSFFQRMKKCQGVCCREGASHGPYWVITAPRGAGKPRQRFVGSDEKKRELEAAWALVAGELAEKTAAVEATPEAKELHRLEALAGKRSHLARTAGVPVFDRRALGGARPKG